MINKEIGSEYWDIPVTDKKNNLFDDVSWFISGRAALDFILKDILSRYENIENVALPSWCCDSMIEPIIRNNLKPVFYEVGIKDKRLYKSTDIDVDVFINLDYFGFECVDSFDNKSIVIDDITHSIFNKDKTNADYYFGSLRKWAGFKTGGFAYCKDGFNISDPDSTNIEYVEKRKKAMNMKREYIDGLRDDKKYLEIFKDGEDMLEYLYDYKADEDDIVKAMYLDIDLIKKKRKENADIIMKHFKDYCIFDDNEGCKLFVPIIVPGNYRDELRRQLISKQIYCPVHWPLTDVHNVQDDYIYQNELSLICDHRYDWQDIEYMCKMILDILEELDG